MIGLENNKVSISVITMGGENIKLLVECLKTLQDNHKFWNHYQLYVSVNENDENVLRKIKKIWPNSHVTMNSKVISYSENHNNNLKKITSKYVILLNDDVIFKSNIIDELSDYLDSNQDVSAISPMLLNPDGTLQASINSEWTTLTVLFMYSGLRGIISKYDNLKILMSFVTRFLRNTSPYIDHQKVSEVKSFAGACYMVRKKIVNKVGMMDEINPFWGEESEWHKRIRNSGGKILYYPKCKVIHIGGQSTGFKSRNYKSKNIKRKNDAMYRNIAFAYLNYFKKNDSGFNYKFVRIIIIINTSIRSIWYRIFKHKNGVEICNEIFGEIRNKYN